uniref:Polyprotein n=1 Tax=Peronospora matthiolae TaxID=2874970 RepID=A0AAV1VL30_9STRA
MPVGWQVENQYSVALSTAESKFVAADFGAKELLGVKNCFREMNVSVKLPIQMMVDNQAAIKQIYNEATSSAQKHVDVKMKFIRDTSSKSIVKPGYIATIEMIADLLTKSVPAPRGADLHEMMGLR